ncbi:MULTISPECIES: hypothetical protein [Streptomyces]|uniref:Uncharacterized protein n=1 Tax=Streptomyces doudnae TaxID=3075536 RepID=A0ABD5ELP5_9ACTN|nr:MULTISPECIES: hypothetical protein [unclassified Streptomyces]MDT0435608.1 hypothetical protein [Streptomyces sp. DSM 41981]MYQ62563.1 hypothetical protein [Streptomyces sp. SID4950]SCD39998.1 hypothetical protein GA0115242_104867 [Streptomyces sp. SolWspMP-5a-2]
MAARKTTTPKTSTANPDDTQGPAADTTSSQESAPDDGAPSTGVTPDSGDGPVAGADTLPGPGDSDVPAVGDPRDESSSTPRAADAPAPCTTCFPGGWPTGPGTTAVGCEHGSWTRTAAGPATD